MCSLDHAVVQPSSHSVFGRACRLPRCDHPPPPHPCRKPAARQEPASPAALGMPAICSSSPPTHRLPRQAPSCPVPMPSRAAHGGSALCPRSVPLLWAGDAVGLLQRTRTAALCSSTAEFLRRAAKKDGTEDAQAQQSHQSWRLVLQQ